MRVLIVRLSALGDVVTASPVSRLIKQAFPDAHITWAIENRCAACVQGDPSIDDVLVVPSSKQWRTWLRTDRGRLWREARELWRRLRGERFDVVLDIHGLFKTAWLVKAVRAPRKIRPADTTERVPFVYNEQAQRRELPDYITSIYVSLAEHLGTKATLPEDYAMTLPISDDDRAVARAWLAEHGLEPGGYVVCAPGTTRPQKMWVLERWAPALAAIHAATGLPAIIAGGPTETEMAETILGAATSPVSSAVCATTIPQTGALLESAALMLTVDTGPMHMAVAVGCPTVAVYGSTPPRLFGPDAAYRPLYRALPCAPCHKRPTCAGRFDCMTAVTVDDVLAAALELLAPSGVQPQETRELP
ncbi:MAG: glycosyltransferase family 9 protein [Armatimonadetes bacterium]|nr:glycosyltransferase family 9 protein [Armatimonadota bacterium]